jgi:Big-like domain-containing protein
MPEQGNGKRDGDSGPAAKIAKITAIIVALTGLVTALVHFRDSIPWLTPVATIEVAPNPINLDVGDRIQIVATVKDSKGIALGKKTSWSSANPGVAEVESSGIVTAKGPGETTIVASIGSIKGVTLAHVRHVNVASVEVFPPATTLEVNDRLKFDATPYDGDGNSLLGRPVRWSSENNSVASAEESSGEVTGKSVGAVRVTAESEGKFNAALVTVNAKPPSTGAGGGNAQPAPPPPKVALAVPPAEGTRRGTEQGRVFRDRVPAAAERRRQEPPPSAAPGTIALAMTQRIAIRGGVKTGDCPATIRVLLGKTLVALESDPQEVLGLPGGDLTYNLHGTVSCARQSLAAVDGHGTISVANQKSYRCHWRRTGAKNYVISLESE